MKLPGLLLLLCSIGSAQTAKRVVIIKVDGLPGDFVERHLDDAPNIRRVFVDHGAWVRNFYVRGISLSAPSWSMLDTGQHLVIRGNAEFDRYKPHVDDYLNFFPFYVGYARSKRTDMPGVEVLDHAGVPLLIDHFAPSERYTSMQLLQRGVRWHTLGDSVTARVKQPVRRLIDEWQTGFDLGGSIYEQEERELLAALQDPKIRYLDYFTGDFDHTAHLTNDLAVQVRVFRRLDDLIGRVAEAMDPNTILILVSDHGMNSVPGTYSQGYNLVQFFNSFEGGGHHVITTRHPMSEYKLRGLNPFVSSVETASADSSFDKDDPTVKLDLDGNERATVYLRNSDLNAAQLLKLQLHRGNLDKARRKAAHQAISRYEGPNRPNTIKQLRHYVTGIAKNGVVLASDGSLDAERTFRHIDYFAALSGIRVRNVVQNDVGAAPVDFLAARRPDGSVLLYGDEQHQAVLEFHDGMLRYSPVSGHPGPGFPLHLFEENAWLTGWRSEHEWLEAIHRTHYSNGLIGLTEFFRPCETEHCRATEPDMLVMASNHWNFNVRGFNPGGNHGSFFRISTHSTLMFAGAGIPEGLRIEEPYDSLSFVPTVMRLMGLPGSFPGPVIDAIASDAEDAIPARPPSSLP
jgi:hypothetical protein